MHCPIRSVIKGPWIIVLFAIGLGWLVASSYSYPPDAQLRSYLEHCHRAQMGPDEGVAFAKVFNGQERRFAGLRFSAIRWRNFDQLIVTVDDFICSHCQTSICKRILILTTLNLIAESKNSTSATA